jgi:beta-ketodecanoyl-[acyl-carrier-protein] synthase
MTRAAISGTGIRVPPQTISNEELVASVNASAAAWNLRNAARIAAHLAQHGLAPTGVRGR